MASNALKDKYRKKLKNVVYLNLQYFTKEKLLLLIYLEFLLVVGVLEILVNKPTISSSASITSLTLSKNASTPTASAASNISVSFPAKI